MSNGNGSSTANREPAHGIPGGQHRGASQGNWTHPAWQAFIRFCEELGHGQIECLKVQDGLPILAEVTKKKVKFT